MNKTILGLILVFIIGFLVGYGAGALSGKTSTQQAKRQARQNLVKQLRDQGIIPPEPESITEVTGTITEVGKNQLSLKPGQRYDDPLNEFLPSVITVKITDQTKITQLKEKSPQVLQQQEQEFEEKMAEYEQQNKEMPAGLNPPELFTEQEIELSALKQEHKIAVVAENNIKGKSEFKAKTIETEVQRSATTTPAE